MLNNKYFTCNAFSVHLIINNTEMFYGGRECGQKKRNALTLDSKRGIGIP